MQKQMLELFWHYIKGDAANANLNTRPSNVPWPQFDQAQVDVLYHAPELDASQVGFFKQAYMTTAWISRTDYRKQANYVPIDDNFDPHQWKDSEDPWIHAICARLLCKPREVRKILVKIIVSRQLMLVRVISHLTNPSEKHSMLFIGFSPNYHSGLILRMRTISCHIRTYSLLMPAVYWQRTSTSMEPLVKSCSKKPSIDIPVGSVCPSNPL